MSRVVVKLGGSLLDLPGLAPRLEAYLASLELAEVLLVVGGGAQADEIRAADREGKLTPDEAHWLAIRAMSQNGQDVAAMLDVPSASSLAATRPEMPRRVTFLDACALLREDEANGGVPLPRTWDITADSVAARLAHRLGIASLILLKSRDIASDRTLAQAASEGVVDAHFPKIAADLDVSLINFRREPPKACCRWCPARARAERGAEH